MPKQLKEHGLRKGNLQVRDEALLEIIRYYTREAGVRTLERQIAKVCRKVAKIIVTAERKRIVVTEKRLLIYLVNTYSVMGKLKNRPSWYGNRSSLHSSRRRYTCH